MIRIALCGDIIFERGTVSEALAACAHEQGLSTPDITAFTNPTDFLDACLSTSDDQEPFDMVIGALELKGISGIHMTSELTAADLPNDGLRIVLCARDKLHAIHAAQSAISAYLVEPITPDHFNEVVGPLLATISQEHEQSIILRCREGVRRILASRLVYVETSGRDQRIHRVGERAPLSIRCSSRALYTILAHDPRFYKAGSSYIINLDYLDSFALHSSSARLLDGTRIDIPIRLRTALAEAISQHAHIAV